MKPQPVFGANLPRPWPVESSQCPVAIGEARLLPSDARLGQLVFRGGYGKWDGFDEAGMSMAGQNLPHLRQDLLELLF
jgi:hypothetical protein